jgi:hypothetical protein
VPVGVIITSNATEVAGSIEGVGPAVEARVVSITTQYGAIALGIVKRNASTGFHAPGEGHIPGTGPGPNVATGDYLRQMNVEMEVGPGIARAHIGTNAVQGRRLEMGFVGADSLGRQFHQPPYPHWGPMADEIGPPFEAALAAAAVPR